MLGIVFADVGVVAMVPVAVVVTVAAFQVGVTPCNADTESHPVVGYVFGQVCGVGAVGVSFGHRRILSRLNILHHGRKSRLFMGC